MLEIFALVISDIKPGTIIKDITHFLGTFLKIRYGHVNFLYGQTTAVVTFESVQESFIQSIKNMLKSRKKFKINGHPVKIKVVENTKSKLLKTEPTANVTPQNCCSTF